MAAILDSLSLLAKDLSVCKYTPLGRNRQALDIDFSYFLVAYSDF